jgi:DNA-binding MarR family transcriptional regulator
MDGFGDAELVRTACDLRVAFGRVVRRLRQAHTPGELTLSEISVLARLDREGPNTPGALAEGERVRPQAMGATLDALEQRGLVARSADPGDGRRVRMSATADGQRLLTDRRQLNNQRVVTALAGFSPAEQRRFAEVVPLLERLADAL